MSEDGFAGPVPERSVPGLRDFAFAGKVDIELPRSAFERLRQGAPALPREAGPFASESIRKVLRARRRRAGLTPARASDRAGIALETPCRIETGRIPPIVPALSRSPRTLEQGAAA